jgi:hypothetical protein
MDAVNRLSVVALLVSDPDKGLVRGQVGTVVEVLAPDSVEVEFSDEEGRTYAMTALKTNDLMVLHHTPVRELA